MTPSNKTNLILLFTLAVLIGLGCGSIESTPADGSSGGSGQNDAATAENEELALEIEDTNEPETSVEKGSEDPKTEGGGKRTVVKFGKGKTSRSYENAVIRGEQDTYVLGAGTGQTMNVSVTSLEDNAGFYIIDPKGKYLGNGTPEEGTTRFNGALPASGNYRIVVSPTRGNATYKINFNVSAREKEEPPPTGSGGRTTVVKFRKGASSANYSNSVIRGERDTYILGAGGGQTMSVSISALEDNAVFDVVSPGGAQLASERRSWTGRLPQDGKYRVIVGGTRGNATYKISFSIR